jgi:hypothetical protein
MSLYMIHVQVQDLAVRIRCIGGGANRLGEAQASPQLEN